MPLTNPLHIGHFRNDGAHSLHTTKCPQGMKTMLTSLSMHTLHVRSSCNLLSCSSMGKSVNMNDSVNHSITTLFSEWDLSDSLSVMAKKGAKLKENLF